MSERTTEERIHELAQGLAPVRQIPPLRWVAGLALVLWLLVLAAEWLLGGRVCDCAAMAWSDPVYLAALSGLVLLALGATSAALAAAVPGREPTARLGAMLAGFGLLLSVSAGLLGLANGIAASGGEEVRAWLACTSRALRLGLASTLVLAGFVVRAAMRRSGNEAALAVAGGVALGAAAVHATCPSDSPLHQLVAHVLTPVGAAVVLTLPLALLMERWVRRET